MEVSSCDESGELHCRGAGKYTGTFQNQNFIDVWSDRPNASRDPVAPETANEAGNLSGRLEVLLLRRTQAEPVLSNMAYVFQGLFNLKDEGKPQFEVPCSFQVGKIAISVDIRGTFLRLNWPGGDGNALSSLR